MANMDTSKIERREYSAPQLSQWGSVANITQVGQTTGGSDTFQDSPSQGQDGGSVCPGGQGGPQC